MYGNEYTVKSLESINLHLPSVHAHIRKEKWVNAKKNKKWKGDEINNLYYVLLFISSWQKVINRKKGKRDRRNVYVINKYLKNDRGMISATKYHISLPILCVYIYIFVCYCFKCWHLLIFCLPCSPLCSASLLSFLP